MNDGSNDEFSAAKKTKVGGGGGGGEEAQRGSVFTVWTYMYIYTPCVCEWVCARVTKVDTATGR